ncbi:MAG: bacteriocin fulvocin C-related protein [Psychroflexus sp.]
MKKSLLLLIILVSFSCQNSELEIDEKSNDSDKYEKLSEMSIENARDSFILLTNNEKAEVWRERLIKLTKGDNLTSKQKVKIEKLLPLVKPDIYVETSNARKELDKELKVWLLDYLDFFTRLEVKVYLTELTPAYPGFGEDCGCNLMDDWCRWSDSCKSSDCYSKQGCGFFWSRRCNGTCK